MSSQTPQTILIVDDTPANLQVLFMLLSEEGFEVAIAESGEMALEALEMIEPQLILLDVMMPGLDGYETCRRLKNNPKTEPIPVIFMSALSDSLNKVTAFEVGAVDYITKPFAVAETMARVRHHLALGAAQTALAALNHELEGRVMQRTAALHQEVQERRQAEAQFRSIFKLAPIGMAVTNAQGQLVDVNQSLCETLGYTQTELLALDWRSLVHPEDREAVMQLYCQTLQGQLDDFCLESRCLTKLGEVTYGLLQAAVVSNNEGPLPTHVICQFMDITHRKQVEAELRHNANHDSLTGLPNRALICQCINQALQASQSDPNHCFALLFLDLNRFKLVNDSLGHQVGDQLLIEISRRLESMLRGSDIIGRLGGDEFVVLLQKIRSINDAVYVAERINSALRKPFLFNGHRLFTSASIGIAKGTSQYNDADELLRNADIAMYSAKAQGREGDYIIFDRAMYEQVSGKLQLETELRQALELEQFQLHYQPIVSVETGELLGFEALVRWFSPEKGMVSPARFIPLAEETGLIVPLGEWILKEAMEQLLRWRRHSPQAACLKMSVNLSIQQLKSPNFLVCLDSMLNRLQFDGKGLQLEITESIFMEDVEGLLSLFQALKLRNIELALDDFGTGYSCLSYLHRFPLDHLKIDRAFVGCISPDGKQSEIAALVINLARQMGMTAIAEGIEEPHQREQLQRLGCAAAQGYWYSKPLNAEAAEQLLLNPMPWLKQTQVGKLAA